MPWTERIDDVVESKHLLKHPFYVAWTRGELSVDALRAYSARYHRHVAAFPSCISAIQAEREENVAAAGDVPDALNTMADGVVRAPCPEVAA